MDIQKTLQHTADVLQRGGVGIYPTDTIWGLGCDATNAEAIAKLCGIKHRDPHKSMLILCKDFEQVAQYVEDFDSRVVDYISRWKTPTTVVYPKAKNLPQSLLAADGSIGIRVPKSEFCTSLIEKFGKPIVSTSANFAGEEPPRYYYNIDAWLIEQVDYLVPEECCDSRYHKSSRIVKKNENGVFVVIR